MTTNYTLTKPDWTPGPLGRDATELARISASPKGWIYTGADGRVEVLVALNHLDGKITDDADLAVLPTFTAAVTSTGILPHLVTGDVITLTLTASEAITVAGTPTIAFTIGANTRALTYDRVNSTSTSLLFTYTVVAGDVALAGAVSVAGAVSFGTYDGIGDVLAGTGGTGWMSAVTFTAPVTTTYYAN